MAGGLAKGKDLCGFRPKEEKFLCNGVDKDVTILSKRDFDGSNVFRKKRPGIFYVLPNPYSFSAKIPCDDSI